MKKIRHWTCVGKHGAFFLKRWCQYMTMEGMQYMLCQMSTPTCQTHLRLSSPLDNIYLYLSPCCSRGAEYKFPNANAIKNENDHHQIRLHWPLICQVYMHKFLRTSPMGSDNKEIQWDRYYLVYLCDNCKACNAFQITRVAKLYPVEFIFSKCNFFVTSCKLLVAKGIFSFPLIDVHDK